MLSELSQREKYKHLISLICGILKANHTCGCQGGEEGSGMDWEFGVRRCRLLPLEWLSTEILLCSPGNYI